MEDIGAILLDMMGTYYGKRPIVKDRMMDEPVIGTDGNPAIDPNTGMMQMQRVSRRVVEDFDFAQFKHLWFNIRADVGATSYYSEIAMTQTLDNLRSAGVLDVIQYLERVPDKLIPKKGELIDELKKAANQPQQTAGAEMPLQGGPLSEDKAVSSLPASVQQRYSTLPNEAKRALRNAKSM